MKNVSTQPFSTFITTLILIAIFTIGNSLNVVAQSTSLWQPLPKSAAKSNSEVMPMLPDLSKQNLFQLSVADMLRTSKSAASEFSAKSTTTATVELPLPDGTFQTFQIWESSIMESGLAAKYPEIKTYVIQGIDDPLSAGRMMISPDEFSAYFAHYELQQEVFIRKAFKGKSNAYVSYFGQDHPRDADWTCNFIGDDSELKPTADQLAKTLNSPSTGAELRVFTLAVSFTGALSEQQGYTTKAEALAGIVSFLSEINAVFERDISVRFVLPAEQDKLIFLSDATDPFTVDGGYYVSSENQIVQASLIGEENYDIGLVLVTGGCCAASLPALCNDSKSRNFSRFRNLRITNHEIGHQFGAYHTWTHCGGQGSFGANEIGNGTTIMGYEGCGTDAVEDELVRQYFGAYSRYIMMNTVAGVSCGKTLATNNYPPVITVPNDGFYIPKETPFTLKGTGTDADDDPVTYSWEQTNILGIDFTDSISAIMEPTAAFGDVPIQRTFNPVSSPERTFPSFPNLLNNISSYFEKLP
ncbi:MAG: reprolysin-like metallopeptidase, partial [Saprospiraceae bacterium]